MRVVRREAVLVVDLYLDDAQAGIDLPCATDAGGAQRGVAADALGQQHVRDDEFPHEVLFRKLCQRIDLPRRAFG